MMGSHLIWNISFITQKDKLKGQKLTQNLY